MELSRGNQVAAFARRLRCGVSNGGAGDVCCGAGRGTTTTTMCALPTGTTTTPTTGTTTTAFGVSDRFPPSFWARIWCVRPQRGRDRTKRVRKASAGGSRLNEQRAKAMRRSGKYQIVWLPGPTGRTQSDIHHNPLSIFFERHNHCLLVVRRTISVLLTYVCRVFHNPFGIVTERCFCVR